MSQREDLTRRRFGLLRVIWMADPGGFNRHAEWVCRCECGTVKTVRSDVLRQFRALSCGCVSNADALEQWMAGLRMPRETAAWMDGMRTAQAICKAVEAKGEADGLLRDPGHCVDAIEREMQNARRYALIAA